MSEVRLYVDEDAGENAVVQGLRARGVDVLTTVEANRCGSTDQDQLVFAIQQGRSIYTFNVGVEETAGWQTGRCENKKPRQTRDGRTGLG